MLDKAISPWSLYCSKFRVDLAFLQQVYAATKECPHLVHGEPELLEDTYYVQLFPVGITPTSAAPRNEREVACAVRGGLAGLSALHAVSEGHGALCATQVFVCASGTKSWSCTCVGN